MLIKKARAFIHTIALLILIPITNFAITSQELLTFYEEVIENIGRINSEQEILDFVSLLQTVRTSIIPSDEQITLEQETNLRSTTEASIASWLIWHGLPETTLATAVEMITRERAPLSLRRNIHLPAISFDYLDKAFLTAPPPSPATSLASLPQIVPEQVINYPKNTNFRLRITNLASMHLLSPSQIFLLQSAANQLSEEHIYYLECLLFFILGKNLNALALSNYSSKELGLDIHATITNCLEFYMSQQLLSSEVYFATSHRLQGLSPAAIRDFIPGFFCIVNNWLSKYQYNFSTILDTIITQLEDTDDGTIEPDEHSFLATHIFTTNNLQMVPRGTLVYYVDMLVFYGCLHPFDGARIRSIMIVAYPRLLVKLMLEALAISSSQCTTMSDGLQIFPTHTRALEITFQHYHKCGEISSSEYEQRIEDLHQAPQFLFEFEADFYRRLLAPPKITSHL